MRMHSALRVAVLVVGAAAWPAAAQEAFDACDVLTQADAEQALGTAAQGEPVNPKVKRPKVMERFAAEIDHMYSGH